MRRAPGLALRALALGLLLAPSAWAWAANFAALGYSAPVPAAWEAQPPTSPYRLAQYRVPGKRGDAEAVVFYFGKGQGGSVAANIARWRSQFTDASGKPVEARTQVLTVADLPLTLVELSGQYARGVGNGPQGQAKADQTLLVGVLETPQGNLTVQLHGPRETVLAHRADFEKLLRSFRRQSP